jgi:hypothetical protein
MSAMDVDPVTAPASGSETPVEKKSAGAAKGKAAAGGAKKGGKGSGKKFEVKKVRPSAPCIIVVTEREESRGDGRQGKGGKGEPGRGRLRARTLISRSPLIASRYVRVGWVVERSLDLGLGYGSVPTLAREDRSAADRLTPLLPSYPLSPSTDILVDTCAICKNQIMELCSSSSSPFHPRIVRG